MQLLRRQSAPPCGFSEPPPRTLQPGGDDAAPTPATEALAASAEERLFSALRREFFPFATPQERSEMRREIWMLEEEFGHGHPFFSKEASPAKCRRQRPRDHWLIPICEEASSSREAAPFELDAAHAFYEPPSPEEADEEEGPILASELKGGEGVGSPCSTRVPSPAPSNKAAARDFWLPVLRRCLTEEHDLPERCKLLREIADLEAATRLPTGRELCEPEAPFEARVQRSLSDVGPTTGSSDSSQCRFVAWRRYATVE